MNIGIDGRAFQGRRTGVGRYVFELCKCLDYLLPDASFYIYSNVPVEMPVISDRWILRVDSLELSKKMKPVVWLKLRCGEMCRSDNLDVFWGPAALLPGLSRNIRTVITVHDLAFKVAPETMSIAHRWAHNLFFARDLRRADFVITNSKGTSKRLMDMFGRRADTIILPAVDCQFRPRALREVSAVLGAYSIADPYILSVATWEPRKNIAALIQTFLGLKRRGELSGYKLVLIGGRGWKDRKLVAFMEGLGRDDIVPVGYVSDDHLPCFYSGAELFVFPSLYEGFGMPVLEARACGTPVVTSDIPELREAGGENTVYVSPTVQGISTGILAALARIRARDLEEILPRLWEQGAANLAAILVANRTHDRDAEITHGHR